MSLSEADVKRLLEERTPDARAATAEKLASQYSASELSDTERAMAEEIFRMMLNDAAVRVRQALSESLAESDAIPGDLAVALAKDIDDVAIPMLEKSTVLSDDDLVEIIKASGGAKQAAIAGRETVSSAVSSALVATDNIDVVEKLISNDGAEISEQSLGHVMDKFGDDARIQGPMVDRAALPPSISERLVSVVSETLRDKLMTHHELSPEMATDLVMQSRERAILGIAKQSNVADLQAMIDQLHRNGRLTHSLILRALCMGDIAFFEASLAQLSKVPLTNVQRLIHDKGDLGLKSLYQHAAMPLEMFPAVRVAVDVINETEYDGNDDDLPRYRRRVVERILTQYQDLDEDSLSYLLDRLDSVGAMAA